MNKIQNKGFTLIELLVVIAIIGILAGIIVVSMGSAQGSAINAKVKATLSQMRTTAELHKITVNGGDDYADLETNTEMIALMGAVDDVLDGGTLVPATPTTDWCYKVSLMSPEDTKSWCTDSNGYIGEAANATTNCTGANHVCTPAP